MSIVIVLIIVLVVGGLVVKFYPHPVKTKVIEEQPTWNFDPKSISESTHITPSIPEIYFPNPSISEQIITIEKPKKKTTKKPTSKNTTKVKPTSKNTAKVKPLAKMEAKKKATKKTTKK
jgi:hypothetical protein